MLRRLPLALALAAALFAIGCYWSYRHDQGRLAAIAAQVAAVSSAQDEQAIALLHWVYNNHGFEKNQGAFLWSKLGPTPIDVLERGGDCADKSRLLSAMLREIDIPSTLAMCFDAHGLPTHVVVEARLADGRRMVLDPIWDLHFPKAEPGQHYGLLDLRRDPEILFRRLEVVTAEAPPDAKIRRYNRAQDVYDRVTTINWDKNALLRWIGDRLAGDAPGDVYGIPRPTVLEEPKLFFAVFGAGATLTFLALYGLLAWRSRRYFSSRYTIPRSSPSSAR